MRRLFWNSSQRRLRMLWRLLVYVLVLVVLVFGLEALVGLLGGPGSFYPASNLLQAGSMVLAAWLVGRFVERRSLAGYGFHLSRRWWRDLAFGMLLGALLMALIFAVEVAAGWVTVTGTFRTSSSFARGFGYALLMFVGVAVSEELFVRGYLLRNLAEGLNWGRLGPRGSLLVAWVATSALFGLLHLANPNATMVSTGSLMVAGLFLGLGLILTGELAIPLGVHLTWNLFQGNVFGFPVSGTTAGTTVLAIRQGGPLLWTGGAFGPEAGLVGLGAVLLGSLLVGLYVRWQYGRAELAMELPERAADTL
jgi:uncharacterized protein